MSGDAALQSFFLQIRLCKSTVFTSIKPIIMYKTLPAVHLLTAIVNTGYGCPEQLRTKSV